MYMKSKMIFRMSLIMLSVVLFAFNSPNSLGGSNERRFWGWGCPQCVPDPNGGLTAFTCTSTYYVLGIGTTETTCQCYGALGNNNCPECNKSNMDCRSGAQ